MTIAQRLRKARASVVEAQDELTKVGRIFYASPHPFTREIVDVLDVQGDLTGIAARLEHMAKRHDTLANL